MLKQEGSMALLVPWEKCLWTTLHLEICTSTVKCATTTNWFRLAALACNQPS